MHDKILGRGEWESEESGEDIAILLKNYITSFQMFEVHASYKLCIAISKYYSEELDLLVCLCL